MTSLGLLTLHISIPGCQSLKEKRRRLKPLMARLHREFNVSVAEVEQQDMWQNAIIACTLVSNDNGFTQRYLHKVISWVENSWPDLEVIGEQIEIF